MRNNKIKALLAFVAIFEGLVGLALIIAPVISVTLLFGGGISGAGLALARLAGFCYLSLGVASLPFPAITLSALSGMLIYNFLAALFLTYLRFTSDLTGKLFLPALLLHAVLTPLLLWAWLKTYAARK